MTMGGVVACWHARRCWAARHRGVWRVANDETATTRFAGGYNASSWMIMKPGEQTMTSIHVFVESCVAFAGVCSVFISFYLFLSFIYAWNLLQLHRLGIFCILKHIFSENSIDGVGDIWWFFICILPLRVRPRLILIVLILIFELIVHLDVRC